MDASEQRRAKAARSPECSDAGRQFTCYREVPGFMCRRNGTVGHMDHTLGLKDSKKRMKLKDTERGLFSIPGEPFRTPQERQSARLPK